MTDQKKDYKKLQEKLAIQKQSCWEKWNDKTVEKAYAFAEGYKVFLNEAKTEREAVSVGVKMAEKKGYENIENKKEVRPGDKVYFVHRDKSVIFAQVGQKGLKKGTRMVMSHIDAPHLDLKVSPLYEEENIAFLKTHYYGGIKKYQWPAIALALHGKAYLADGRDVDIIIGEKEDDPVFMITDLLPHLDKNREGSAGKDGGVQGEHLNMVVGSRPVKAVDKKHKLENKVKLAVLEYLHDRYGIVEEDLASAELQAVPSEKARDLGFDKSMISAYGHDDKICSYSCLQSLFDSKNGNESRICIWVDREEIGSEGATGAKSLFIERFLSILSEKLKDHQTGISEIYKIFSQSKAISADVTAAIDPDYKEVHDPRNAPRAGFGLAMEKYTGAGGKVSTSEASGSFVRELRNILNKNKDVLFQLGGGLGKIDQGGGGTIAKFMANRDIEIIDMGVPLFNMHAPLEIASKADLYCAYLGYKEFLQG
ncbi:MAG: aminopeptidase [Patescibacteria group bacterium]